MKNEILLEGYVFEKKNLNESLKEYRYDEELAKKKVNEALRKYKDKLKKKGYLPMTTVNDTLLEIISELGEKENEEIPIKPNPVKINGVICIRYKLFAKKSYAFFNFIGKEIGKIDICFYNKEKDKVKFIRVNATVKNKY